MIDTQYMDAAVIFINLVNDAVRASARGPQPLEFPVQGMAHPLRVLDQRPQQEFNDRDRRSLGKAT